MIYVAQAMSTLRLGLENEGFVTLTTYQMLSVYTAPEKFENESLGGHFGFMSEENSSREYHDYRNIVYEKPRSHSFFFHSNK